MAAAKKVKMSSATRGNPYGKTGAPGKQKPDAQEVESDASDAVDAQRRRPARDDLQAMGIDMPPPARPAGPPQMPAARPPMPPGAMQRPGMPPGGAPPMGMPPGPPPGPPPPGMMPPQQPMALQRSPQELETLRRMQGLYGG